MAEDRPGGVDYSGFSFDEKMRVYYSKLFPYEPMHQWLSYGGSDRAADAFSKREFSFTLANDVYIRFLSYTSPEDWKADMIKKVPHKIDMGAVYSKEPNQKAYISKDAFKEVSREFVLDIDLTDYQEDGTIKSNCIDPTDRDERARLLNDNARTAVAEYLNIFKGGDKDKTRLDAVKGTLHPALQRAYEDVLYPKFQELMEDQQWFDEESMAKTLDLVDDPEIKSTMLQKWSKRKKASQQERWEDLTKEIRNKLNNKKTPGKGDETIKFIIFRLTYPRLDIAVSKMMNHLLKSPFCVHPKTQRICVPLNPSNIEEFDPNDVPSLEDILRDMEHCAKQNDSSESKKRGPSSPQLDRYVKTFKSSFLTPLLKDVSRTHRAQMQAIAAF